MSIAKLLQREYPVEEAMSDVELAVAQLIDDNFQQEDEEKRADALLRVLFILNESNDELRQFILHRAMCYAFWYTPHHTRAWEEYLRELKGKGRKQERRIVKAQVE